MCQTHDVKVSPRSTKVDLRAMFGLDDGIVPSLSRTWTDPPAVVGVVAKVAIEQLLRYRDLGVEEWALDTACKDAQTAFRTFRVFLEGSRLPFVHTDPETVLSYWRLLWLAGLYIPLAKWATAEPLAMMAGVTDKNDTTKTLYKELPPRPDWLPGGYTAITSLFPEKRASAQVRVALRTRLGEKSPDGSPKLRAKALAWSLLGIKAMMPPLWVDQVTKSMKDHAALLSSTPVALPRLHTRVLEVVSRSIANLLTKTVIRNVGGKDVTMTVPQEIGDTVEVLPRPKLSSSAGWVKQFDTDTHRFKTQAGTRAAQWDRLGGIHAEELTSMHTIPHNRYKTTYEVRQVPYQYDWTDWDFDPRATVVALQEPFKIRTITIADGPATAAGSSFQSQWHQVMRNLTPFQLIGGKKVMDCVDRFPFDGTPFVSGDYSAATDRVNIKATELVFHELTKHMALDPELRRRLRDSLLSAQVSYEGTLNSFKKKIPKQLYEELVFDLPHGFQQTNGQLMGNVLSFPILCIINLASWLISHYKLKTVNDTHLRTQNVLTQGLTRGYFTRSELNAFPVLINGDDILFQAEPELYESWRRNLPPLGFKLSVGKNYYSDKFFTVNSELYSASGRVTRPWWGGFLPDFVRMRNEIKWETGLDVLSADMRRVLHAVQADLKESVPDDLWPVFNRHWFRIIGASDLMLPYVGLNWFIPIQFGGMGLDSGGLDSGKVTYKQKKLAVRSMLDPEHAPQGYGADGSLPSAEKERDFRMSLNVQERFIQGDLVKIGNRSFVPDPNHQISARLEAQGDTVTLRIHPSGRHFETVNSAVQASGRLDKWLDHHLDGTRIDVATIKKRVTRSLDWGLKLSDKKADRLFESLVLSSTHRVLSRPTVIQVGTN